MSKCNDSVKRYTPIELVTVFNNWLTDPERCVICIEGIYKKVPRGKYVFDYITDDKACLGLHLSLNQKRSLEENSFVRVFGTLTRRLSDKGIINLVLEVSRIEVVEERVVDEAEVERFRLLKEKMKSGHKNVDQIITEALFEGRTPSVALLYADGSITDQDFEGNIDAARASVGFSEVRESFANTPALCAKLAEIDGKGFDAIAIVRGGGSGLENLDAVPVLETVVQMKTPVIAAIGHVADKLFIKEVADKTISTPSGLGKYFSDLVEGVARRKENSRSALTKEIAKQFEDRLASEKKNNEDLRKQVETLTASQKKTSEQYAEERVQANARMRKAENDGMAKDRKIMEYESRIKSLDALATNLREQYDKKVNESNSTVQALQKELSEIKEALSSSDKNFALEHQQVEVWKQKAASSRRANYTLFAVMAIMVAIAAKYFGIF